MFVETLEPIAFTFTIWKLTLIGFLVLGGVHSHSAIRGAEPLDPGAPKMFLRNSCISEDPFTYGALVDYNTFVS